MCAKRSLRPPHIHKRQCGWSVLPKDTRTETGMEQGCWTTSCPIGSASLKEYFDIDVHQFHNGWEWRMVVSKQWRRPPSPLRYPSRFALSAVNMEHRDYDSRTALHVAAAEGDMTSSVHTFSNIFRPWYSNMNKCRVELGPLIFFFQVMWMLLSS